MDKRDHRSSTSKTDDTGQNYHSPPVQGTGELLRLVVVLILSIAHLGVGLVPQVSGGKLAAIVFLIWTWILTEEQPRW